MDNPLQKLVDKVWQLYQDMPHDRRLCKSIVLLILHLYHIEIEG